MHLKGCLSLKSSLKIWLQIKEKEDLIHLHLPNQVIQRYEHEAFQ